MKKLLVVGALALAVALLSERQASAWCSWKFGVGLNLEHQSGGNNFGWGFFRNGQPPGCPDCVNCAPNCPSAYYKNLVNYGVPPGMCPGGPGGHPGPGPDFGHGFGHNGPMMGGPDMAPYAAPAPTPLPAPGADNQVYWFNTPTYSNVNFQPSYYQQGGYFMPVSNYDR